MNKAMELLLKDEFAKFCGIEVVEAKDGFGKSRMIVEDRHLNGLEICQGGVIFTLADVAFAAACNSKQFGSVAVNVSLTFLKAGKKGELTAQAREVSTQGKVGVYEIEVKDGEGEVIAAMQGTSYRTKRVDGK